jgi:hypothetical protein
MKMSGYISVSLGSLFSRGPPPPGQLIDSTHGDGLQARGAEAVDGDAGGGDRQAGEQARLAADVAGAVGDIAHEDVLHRFRFDARLGDGVLHGVGGHGHGGRDVESAPARLGQARAGIGNDHRFAHHKISRMKNAVVGGDISVSSRAD